MRHTVAAASSAVVVVVVNFYSLRADRGKGLHDLLSILLGLFGSVESVKQHAPSVLLAISHCPVQHPETGAPMSLERYQRKSAGARSRFLPRAVTVMSPGHLSSHCTLHLAPCTLHPDGRDRLSSPARHAGALLDPAGLDETTSEVLRALLAGGNVGIFHLLGRGDASWLSRDQILERVRALPPMSEPRAQLLSIPSGTPA